MENWLEINQRLWDARTRAHVNTVFYNTEGFLQGQNMLMQIEKDLLGDISGKDLLHLQCHFGLDTLSLARLGANVTGLDLSDVAIAEARSIASRAGIPAQFICSDLYSAPDSLNGKFDIVFTSWGTIGWLPDLNKWAAVIARALRPGGRFVFAEFHPVLWMLDDAFEKITYGYFNTAPIEEMTHGTYADKEADIHENSFTWNHSIAESVQALIDAGLRITDLQEYDYSPYSILPNCTETGPGKYQIKGLEGKVPIAYSLVAVR